jgi:hypothetical protein
MFRGASTTHEAEQGHAKFSEIACPDADLRATVRVRGFPMPIRHAAILALVLITNRRRDGPRRGGLGDLDLDVRR